MSKETSYFLAAKESLQTIEYVTRAQELCLTARQLSVELTVVYARSTFLENAFRLQLDVLRIIHQKSDGLAQDVQLRHRQKQQELQGALQRLDDRLSQLKATVVDPQLRPASAERTNLLDFVDTSGVAGLTARVGCLENQFCRIEPMRSPALPPKLQLSTRPFKVLDRITAMDDQARDMAMNLESLVRHFDACSALVEGSSDAEMLAVLRADAEQVDEVVEEIRIGLEVVETDYQCLVDMKTGHDKDADLLDKIARTLHQRMPQLHEHELGLQYESHANDLLNSLRDADDFYKGYAAAYESLVAEAQRRKKVQQVQQDLLSQLDRLAEEDLREREAFRDQYGDFLPADIWSGLYEPPER